MRRLAFVAAIACVLTVPALVQAQAPADPAKAKYVPAVKGIATIDVIQMPSKRVGQEMVTVLKIKNTSKGSINLFKLDEYWYDSALKIISSSQYRHRKAPIQPGEIVEITLRTPVKPGMTRNQVMFTHANGDAKATTVKAFK